MKISVGLTSHGWCVNVQLLVCQCAAAGVSMYSCWCVNVQLLVCQCIAAGLSMCSCWCSPHRM
jgi:hypothetical protein